MSHTLFLGLSALSVGRTSPLLMPGRIMFALCMSEIQIKGFPPIPCVDGYFHCPKCTHKSRNAHSFYRHPHILEMRGMGAKQPTTDMPSHVATRESTVPILPQPSPRSPTPAPLLPEPE